MRTPSHDPGPDAAPRSPAYEEYEGTPLWAALGSALADLTTRQELVVGTAPHYVLGHLCQELAAKRAVQEAALRRVE
ncbi:hypothetical protein [Roseisolibacter sp. H3M3-2]|uniref:hypothetical protein n=1 Tax=Roseisolibacter sp. H3M3-2 TaxID=3031323 RepID=UPI0023DB74AD|nr:hypothetical protein [Roseisolibacter sp. H3M3-2]MDF1501370.1 hypothetical protein [Roseisolibacter sp. H3M3-2]